MSRRDLFSGVICSGAALRDDEKFGCSTLKALGRTELHGIDGVRT